MKSLIEAIKGRRTNYALGKNIPLRQEQITQIIETILPEVPSAFNMQSARVVVLLGENHEKVWALTKKILAAIVPAEKFSATDEKINGFAAAYGTILFFEDMPTVEKMQKAYPSYAENFPIWAQQANGMLQFAIWTALTEAGLGVNLQHYNPLIDADVKTWLQLPAGWKLTAQMPFGEATAAPKPIEKLPLRDRLKIIR